MVLSSMQLQKVSVTLWFRRLQCLVLRSRDDRIVDFHYPNLSCFWKMIPTRFLFWLKSYYPYPKTIRKCIAMHNIHFCAVSNLEHSYQLFETCVYEASKKSILQTKRFAKISVPWWNKECEHAIKYRKHAFTRMKCTRSPVDIIIFKRCRAKPRQIILESKRSSWHNYCNSLKSSSHLTQFWRTTKKFSGQRSCYHIPSLQQNRIIAKNNQHKANMLAQ